MRMALVILIGLTLSMARAEETDGVRGPTGTEQGAREDERIQLLSVHHCIERCDIVVSRTEKALQIRRS
jgi:hypothetical protein